MITIATASATITTNLIPLLVFANSKRCHHDT
jgi:hypothetical protein